VTSLAVTLAVTLVSYRAPARPGDTTGLSSLSPTDIVASWGSDHPDVSGNRAEIYAANIAATLP
jgi:hypothetical protein